MRAADLALRNPLLRQIDIMGATNLLINVAGSEEMGQREAMQAVKCVVDRAGDLDREIFMGVVTDNSLGDSLSVTIIATGLPDGNGRVIPLARGNADQSELIIAPDNPEIQATGASALMGLVEEVAESGHPSAMAEIGGEVASCAPDGLGRSPLICKVDWQTPAYLRRRSIARTAEAATSVPKLNKAVSRNRAPDSHTTCLVTGNRHFRQPLYNLA